MNMGPDSNSHIYECANEYFFALFGKKKHKNRYLGTGVCAFTCVKQTFYGHFNHALFVQQGYLEL